MNCRSLVGLIDQDECGSFHECRKIRRQNSAVGDSLDHGYLVVAQQAETRPGNDRQCLFFCSAFAKVVAIAEERKIIVVEPTEESRAFVDFILRHICRGRGGIKLGDNVCNADAHRPPVLHGGAHIAQDFLKRLCQFLEHSGIGLLRDLQVHYRFSRAVYRIAVFGNMGQFPRRAALGRNDGVNDKMDCQVPLVQFGGNRIDQKRHVVIDDLDNGMAAFPAVFLFIGVEDPDLRCPGFAGLGELP